MLPFGAKERVGSIDAVDNRANRASR